MFYIRLQRNLPGFDPNMVWMQISSCWLWQHMRYIFRSRGRLYLLRNSKISVSFVVKWATWQRNVKERLKGRLVSLTRKVKLCLKSHTSFSTYGVLGSIWSMR